MSQIDLPLRQQQLYDALKGQGDVQISELCKALDGPSEDTPDQMWLSPYITRLNRRLARRGQAVKPGALKGTYHLIVT